MHRPPTYRDPGTGTTGDAARGPRRVATGLVALLAALAAATVAALPEDRLKAIAITADRAERHERGGYTIYIGSVILDQGSLHIEADRLTIFHDREAADRIVAVGTPARMRQQPAVDKGPVHASAMRIVYEKSRELVLLKDTASIEQDGAVVTGESIEYFMAEQRVRADSAATDDDARVQVYIPAEIIEEQSGEGRGDDASEPEAEAPDKKSGAAGDEGALPPPDPATAAAEPVVGMAGDTTGTDGKLPLTDGDAGRP